MADAAYTVLEHTASDGYRWRYRRYVPAGAPRAEVVYLHGIQSHAGWYEGSCTRLQQDGYAVSFLDRRGSGMNQQARGDAPSFRRLLDDVAEHVRPLPRPVYLLAVSWGGKLAAALQRRHQGLVDALALLCPGYFPQVRPPFGTRMAILFSRLTRPRRLFPIPLTDPELFTATPRWLEFLRADPLALHQATARLLIESVRLDGYLRFVAKHVRVPVLLMLAGKDRVIKNAETRAYFGRFASADRTVIEYEGAHHTLEFEPEPGPVFEDLLDWLRRRAASGNP